MNIHDLSNKVYHKTEGYNQYGLPAYVYKNIIGTTMDTIAEALSSGDSVTIRGLISMKPLWSHSHYVYNIDQKKKEKVPGKVRIRCRVSKSVLDELNKDRMK